MKTRLPYLAVPFLSGLILFGTVLLLTGPAAYIQANASQTAIYVARDGVCGGQIPCFDNVQQAVNAAQMGDQILVASGIYTGVHPAGESMQLVYISKTVSICGGYTVTNWVMSKPEENLTILDAQRQGHVFVITGNISPTIENLFITGGDASQGGGVYAYQANIKLIKNQFYNNNASDIGGGLHLFQCRGVLDNNVIFSNTSMYGGGVHLGNSPVLIDKNVIVSNTAENWGGGLYLRESYANLLDNTISYNSALGGAAGGLALIESDATLAGNTFSFNTTELSGGAIYLHYSDADLLDNLIADNGAHNSIFLWHSDARLDSNLFARNNTGLFMHASAAEMTNNAMIEHLGWAIEIEGASPGLVNNTISSNHRGIRIAPRMQQDIYYTSTVTLTNTILANHNTGLQIGADNRVLVDTVLWYNTSSTMTMEASSVVTILNQRAGNPAFDSDGYHITPLSAALDAGVNAGLQVDIDGHFRPYNKVPDIGADEIIAANVPAGAGSALVYSDTQRVSTIVQMPAEAVTETVLLAFTPVDGFTGTSSLVFAGHAFVLDAYRNGVPLLNFVFEKPVTITIYYTDSDIVGLDESILTLENWNNATARWEDAACGPYQRQPDANWLAAPVCHLSKFALFEKKTCYIFVPLVSSR